LLALSYGGKKGEEENFSPQQKVAILKKHLVEKVPLADVCGKYGLHPSVFYWRQKAFFEWGYLAFESSDARSFKRDRKIEALER
jgi:transposase-like protein